MKLMIQNKHFENYWKSKPHRKPADLVIYQTNKWPNEETEAVYDYILHDPVCKKTISQAIDYYMDMQGDLTDYIAETIRCLMDDELSEAGLPEVFVTLIRATYTRISWRAVAGEMLSHFSEKRS